MDIVFICRDALSNSLLNNLLMATEARKEGSDVAIIFTQEALAGLCGDALAWSRGLQGQGHRMQMVNQAQAMDIPVSGTGQGKQLNARPLVAKAQKAGVKMIACPIWTSLLGLEGRLPRGIEKTDLSQALQCFMQCNNSRSIYSIVIGKQNTHLNPY